MQTVFNSSIKLYSLYICLFVLLLNHAIFVKTFFMQQNARAVYNPVQKDTAIFIKTAAETNGAYSLIEVIVGPGGGVGKHYHKTYTETITCLEGELQVLVGKKLITLTPGDGPATAGMNVLHRFFNASSQPCRFSVFISPGCRGFEESIQIAYGLARDGAVHKDGAPKKLDHLGVLMDLGQVKIPGVMGLLEPVLLWFGKRAGKKGVTDALRKAYVKI